MRATVPLAALLGSLFFGLAASSAPVLPKAPERPNHTGPSAISSARSSNLDREDLEAWLDGLIPASMARGDLAGAVVVIVKDDRILLQKGYGYSDVAAKMPVDPERTLFRTGSVSKLFTWTAVMQLVEKGKLDLDTDINAYLDFKIPAYEGQPITLRNILTHTSGFEEVYKNLLFDDPDGPKTLGDYMKIHVPARIFPPGRVPAYSNYATGLAGYIVQRVSGERFELYVDRHILTPLQMNRSTFRQPLPPHLSRFLSKGYARASGAPKPFELVGAAPAGAMSATGADMGRFMIAQLQRGAGASGRILEPRTASMMQEATLRLLPPLNAMRLGFYETGRAGVQAIGHGGDTQWMHSHLQLYSDAGAGLFLSINSTGNDGAAYTLRAQLLNAFVDRYLGGHRLKGSVDAGVSRQHAARVAGRYISSRRAESSFLSLSNLLGQTVAEVNDDGTLSISAFQHPNGEPRRWRAIAPMVWTDEEGKERLGARLENGRVAMFSTDDSSPQMVFLRVPAGQSGGWLLPSLCLSFAALIVTGLSWPAAALGRRHCGGPLVRRGRDAWPDRFVPMAALAAVGTFLAYAVLINWLMTDFRRLGPSSDPLILVLQVMASLAFIGGALLGMWNLWRTWAIAAGTWARLWSLILAMAFIVILWTAFAFHLISFGTGY